MRYIRIALRYVAIIAAVSLFSYVAGYTGHKIGEMPQGRLAAPELQAHGGDHAAEPAHEEPAHGQPSHG